MVTIELGQTYHNRSPDRCATLEPPKSRVGVAGPCSFGKSRGFGELSQLRMTSRWCCVTLTRGRFESVAIHPISPPRLATFIPEVVAPVGTVLRCNLTAANHVGTGCHILRLMLSNRSSQPASGRKIQR